MDSLDETGDASQARFDHILQQRNQLWRSLQRLDGTNPVPAIPHLAELPESLVDGILQLGQACPETSIAFTRLLNSKAAAHAWIQEEVDALKQLKHSQKKIILTSAANLLRGLYPVRVSGLVVAVLDTGPMKIGALTDDEARTLGKLLGLTTSDVTNALSNLPALTAKQAARFLTLYQHLADQYANQIEAFLEQAATRQAQAENRDRTAASPLARNLGRHLNGVLGAMLGYAAFTSSQDLPPDVQDALSQIVDLGDRGRQLTEWLFGADESTEESTPMNGALAKLIDLIQAQRSSSISLSHALEATEDSIALPSSGLHPLLFNLLLTAMDWIPDGGDLSVGTENRPVAEGSTESKIHLTLSDGNAEPFDSESPILTQGLSAFGPLDDGDQESTLARLHGEIDALGGEIKVHPQPGLMPSIELVLPVQASVDAVETESSPGVRSALAERVWLVVHDRNICNTHRELLEHTGHTVREFATGTEMQQAWESEVEARPALMLYDFSLPDLSGEEARAWLDENGGSALPLLLIGHFDPKQTAVRRALASRRNYYLQLPFSQRDLLEMSSVAMGETLLR